jgi:hypothetical protein
MKPSVSRMVHYVSHGTPVREDGTQAYPSVCRSAVVTAVPNPDDPSVVHLCVLNPEGMFFNKDVAQDEGDENGEGRWGGTWHWPERVDG